MNLHIVRHNRYLFLILMALSVSIVSMTFAASDPSIRDWGSPPGSPPPYQTQDIWVDNDGNGIHNEPGEPSKGMINRLFGKIRNLGTTTAGSVTVRFAYAPYGAWGWSSYSDFKEIAAVTGVTLTAAGTADAEKMIEVQWDLRDLTENNGGHWGGYTVGDFDHFCVWVKVEFATDANTSNNDARNNFVQVQTVAGQPYSLKFLVPNPKKEMANAELIVKGLPENWKSKILGIENVRQFTLKPNEYRLVTLTFTPPQEISKTAPRQNAIDISLKLDKKIVGGISFTTTPEKPAAFTPADGVLSPYIIGTYDNNRDSLETVLQIINPTGKHLRIIIAFFDDNEKALKCIRERLSPNDMVEINVHKLDLQAKVGVVKIVSLNAKEDVPETGVVGYKRTYVGRMMVSETVLHQIPTQILKGDLKYIMQLCR